MVKISINSLSDNSNKKKLFLGMCLQVSFITVLAVSLKILKYKNTLKNLNIPMSLWIEEDPTYSEKY